MIKQGQEDYCKFKDSLIYKVSSRPNRTIWWEGVSKKKKKTEERRGGEGSLGAKEKNWGGRGRKERFVQTFSVVPVLGREKGFWLLAQTEDKNVSEYPHSTQDGPSGWRLDYFSALWLRSSANWCISFWTLAVRGITASSCLMRRYPPPAPQAKSQTYIKDLSPSSLSGNYSSPLKRSPFPLSVQGTLLACYPPCRYTPHLSLCSTLLYKPVTSVVNGEFALLWFHSILYSSHHPTAKVHLVPVSHRDPPRLSLQEEECW